MSPNYNMPEPRSMAEEGRDSLQAQIDLAPQTYAARAEYDPLYAQLNVDTLRAALNGSGDSPGLLQTYREIAPQLSALSSRAQSDQRAADVADVMALGPKATQAMRAANPEAAALEAKLMQQANAGLDAGTSLDPDQRRQLQETARAGQADRGLGFGPADVFNEQLLIGDAGERMRSQRQAFASGILNQSRAATVDPFMAILNRQSMTPAMATGVVGQGQGIAGAVPSFDPFNAYAADLNNTNLNMAASGAIANANNGAALIGSGLGAASKIGAATLTPGSL